MDSSMTMSLETTVKSQPIVEVPVDEDKDMTLGSTDKVTQVLTTRIHEAVVADDADDDCVICYSTLFRPVKTTCRHSACEACMLHWALTAMEQSGDQTEIPSNLTVDGINFRCPTCRTYTTATFDAEQDARLRKAHPEEYETREQELHQPEDDLVDEYATRSMMIMFGNSHRKVEPTISPYTGKMRHHEWTFFVKSSRPELIDEVRVVLHPTFRNDRLVTLREPPFSTTHLGWGYFTIFAGLQLHKGYEWVDQERAVGRVRNGPKDTLPIDWLLDFRGNGSQNNQIVKFRKVKDEPQLDDDDGVDLSVLAEFMTETEIEELREVRRNRMAARRAQEQLEMSES